jgi:beta-lactamase superfamily II metal-dependent hydrolase
LKNKLGYELPLLQRKISALVIAGTHTNQVAGLAGLTDHLMVKNAFLPPTTGGYSYQSIKEELTGAGVDVRTLSAGQKIEFGGGANMEIIECTDKGIVLMLNYERAHILIPAGMTSETAETILDDPRLRDASVLLLPDGGHPASNPPDWLEMTNPRLAILSVSGKGDLNRPSIEVLANLDGRTILRTDQHGSIAIHTDGELLWAETERQIIEQVDATRLNAYLQ